VQISLTGEGSVRDACVLPLMFWKTKRVTQQLGHLWPLEDELLGLERPARELKEVRSARVPGRSAAWRAPAIISAENDREHALRYQCGAPHPLPRPSLAGRPARRAAG